MNWQTGNRLGYDAVGALFTVYNSRNFSPDVNLQVNCSFSR